MAVPGAGLVPQHQLCVQGEAPGRSQTVLMDPPGSTSREQAEKVPGLKGRGLGEGDWSCFFTLVSQKEPTLA